MVRWQRYKGRWYIDTGDNGHDWMRVWMTDAEARAFADDVVTSQNRPLSHEAVAAMEAG